MEQMNEVRRQAYHDYHDYHEPKQEPKQEAKQEPKQEAKQEAKQDANNIAQHDNIAQPDDQPELMERLSTLENTMAYTESSVDGLVMNFNESADKITNIGEQIKALRIEIKDINTELNLAFANIDKMKTSSTATPTMDITTHINQAIAIVKGNPEFQIQLIYCGNTMMTINDSAKQVIKWTIQ
jgi:archaellum component FlaC